MVWGFDKYRAVTGRWRVPEKALITMTLLGGAFGALAGMLLFRHKTRRMGYWLLVGVACVIHGWILVMQLFSDGI